MDAVGSPTTWVLEGAREWWVRVDLHDTEIQICWFCFQEKEKRKEKLRRGRKKTEKRVRGKKW